MNNVKKQRETKEWETRDLFKKIGDTKETFHARMGIIKIETEEPNKSRRD